jgi:hypothetical protein
MYRLPLDQQVLLVLQTAAQVGLCVHMWRARLQQAYGYFFAYLLLALLQTVLLGFIIPYDRPAYVSVWLVTEGSIVCFYAFIVLELYTIVLEDLAGLASVSRRYLRIALAAAILISAVLLSFEKNPPSVTGLFLILERTIVGSLLIFVLFITMFLVYYPVPLNRNVIVYSVGYAVYFLTKAAALFIRNLGHRWDRPLGDVLIVVSTSCLLFWMFALNRSGEAKTVVFGHKWRPEDEERLLLQLKGINASLSRAARK